MLNKMEILEKVKKVAEIKKECFRAVLQFHDVTKIIKVMCVGVYQYMCVYVCRCA